MSRRYSLCLMKDFRAYPNQAVTLNQENLLKQFLCEANVGCV
jgi:hypothetical protein